MYITIKRKIIDKNIEIANNRKYILNDYIYMSNKLLLFSHDIENKSEKLNKIKIKNIKAQEKLLEKLTCKMRFSDIKIRNKKTISKELLKNSTKKDQNINKKINELKKTIKLYLAYKK
jgi:hypothetical protein